MRLRSVLAATGIALWLAATGTHSVAADGPPAVDAVSPQSLGAGQPLRVTITGRGLHDITDVLLDPEVPGRVFQVFNDTTALLTLPAATPAGTYAIRVISPEGGSPPGSAPQVRVLAAPPTAAPADNSPALLPHYSFLPQPADSSTSRTETSPAVPTPASAGRQVLLGQVVTNNPFTNPFFDVAIGIWAGGAAYVLWGNPGRMQVARRRDLGAQLIGRPAQRFHLARVCLQCGKLHWILRTRRDLWKAGQFCSATCFVLAQEVDLATAEADVAAPGRLREVTVYPEMEQELEAALAGEAADAGTPEALFAGN